MKHFVALLAMVLAMPMFADGNSDSGDELTHKKIQDNILSSIANLSNSLDSKVNSLQTALEAAQSAITTLQGAATRNEVAIVMTVPVDGRCRQAPSRKSCLVKTFLMGSTIPGFPRGTVNSTTFEFTDRTLPGGTYLIELQQPYSDNLLCHGAVTGSLQINSQTPRRRFGHCPQLRILSGTWRLDDGSRVYTVGSSGRDLLPEHRFPGTWEFTTSAPASSYAGTIKITRLKP